MSSAPALQASWPRRVAALALAIVVALAALTLAGRGPFAGLHAGRIQLAGVTASAAPAGNGNGNNGNGNGNGGTSNGNSGNGNGNAPFTISGTTTGLAPGVTRPLNLTISNTQNFDIIVQTVTVTVGSAGAGCPGSNATATGFSGSLTVPKNGTAPLVLSIRMVANAANACQGKTFPLTYGGTGVKK